ncbi:uncharacterized protein [Cicer arietinum]|uniref:uncharacterized protein n=1 Tax=Cicer arietinum TaxID=3827 RepID=UPI003CC5D732
MSYEGSKKIQEENVDILVIKYELFKVEEDEGIKTMFSRFQTLVSGLKILQKSYTTIDHVKKILSIPSNWGSKITSIQELKDLNSLKLEELRSSLRLHEIQAEESSEDNNIIRG